MPYGSHPTSVANFKLIDQAREFYFFGDDNVIKASYTPIELAEVPRSGIEGLLIGIDQGIIECLDWTSDDIRFYFLHQADSADDITFTPHPPEITATNVQDAIEQLLDYTVTQAGHVHANMAVLQDITDAGSGQIITPAERSKLQGIEANATRDQEALEVPFEPDGDITSANVQDAIEEVRNDTDVKLTSKSNLGHTHDAADIDGLSAAINAHPNIHSHGNKPILDQITDAGSGQIITDDERDKLESVEFAATRDQLASEVPIVDAGNCFASGNVEGALQELGPHKHSHTNLVVLEQITNAGSGQIITIAERNKLAGIEAGATQDQIALEVPFTPNGDIVATNVQQAIIEVRNDTDAKIANHPHHASGVTYTNISSGLSATNVQQALDEIDIKLDEVDSLAHDHSNKAVLDQITEPGSGKIITDAERAKLGTIETGATADQVAVEVPYSAATSSLTSSNVQDAIDELDSRIDDIDLPLRTHNNLSGLQGGNITERYHLTEAQIHGLVNNETTNLHKHNSGDINYINVPGTLVSTNVSDALDELAEFTRQVGDHGLYKRDLVSDQNTTAHSWQHINFNHIQTDTFQNVDNLFTFDGAGVCTFHQSGKYEVFLVVEFRTSNLGSIRAIRLEKATDFEGGDSIFVGNSSPPKMNDKVHVAASFIFEVVDGDKIRGSVFQDSGQNISLDSRDTALFIRAAQSYTLVYNGSGPSNAVDINFSPTVNISSTNVQAAIEEIYNELQNPTINPYESYVASAIITALRAVKITPDKKIAHASNNVPEDANEVLGISIDSGAINSSIRVVRSGYYEDPSWTWIPHKNLFVDLNGQISQTLTPRSFIKKIGKAISATEVHITIDPPIITS